MRIDPEVSCHAGTDQLHGHRHQAAYVALVMDGGYHELGPDGAWLLEPGDVVVHPPYHFHANSFTGQTRVLNFRIPDTLAREQQFQSYAVVRPRCSDDLLRKGADFAALHAALATADTLAAREPSNWVDLMAQDIVADSGVRIADLAQRYRVSTEHVSRRFRQRYLMTPSTLRGERRFRRALELLSRTRHTLTDIAHMAGYADQSHFSRSCLRVTGLSPGNLRLKFS